MESTLLNSSANLEHSNAEASSRVVEKLLQLAKWSDIYPYLLENGYAPASQGTEKQAKRALVDLDTYVVALLLCHKFFDGGEPFTLRSLSMAMDGEDFNSIKAMEKRLRLLIERLERFNIIRFYKDTHRGKRECWRIEATPTLVNFIETRI